MSYPLPYTQQINLTDGMVITINGVLTPHAKSLGVAFVKERDCSRETVMITDFRFEHKVVVRNHRLDSGWGQEERQGSIPLKPGDTFEVKIEVKSNEFKVFVNGAHFCDFKCRIPKENARNLLVQGDATIHKIQCQGAYSQDPYAQPYGGQPQNPPYGQPYGGQPYGGQPPNPQYGGQPYGGQPPNPQYGAQQYGGQQSNPVNNPPVPMTIPISSLHQGRKITITGTPTGGQRFSVYLLCGPSVDHDVAFLADVRFNFGSNHNQVVSNHKTGSNWGQEVIGNQFPFSPNSEFEMVIKIKDNSYRLIVNDEKIMTFPFRITPDRITHLNVQGDVRLNHVKP